MDFGSLLRTTRSSLGLDQATLARRSGTTQTYISRIERNDVSPSLKTMRRLMHAMGQDLVLDVRPLTPGNASPEDLRSDFVNLTPEERVQQAMELSEFLLDIAEQAGHGAAPAPSG